MKLYGILIVFLVNVLIVTPSPAQVDSAKFDLGETCHNCFTEKDYLMALVDYRSDIVRKYNPYLHNTEHFSYFALNMMAYMYGLSGDYVDTLNVNYSSLDQLLNPDFQKDIGHSTPGFGSHSREGNREIIEGLAAVYDSLHFRKTILAVREAYPLLLNFVVDYEWPIKLKLNETPLHEELASYKVKPSDVVGDVGTGSGLMLNILARLGLRCYGTELGDVYSIIKYDFTYLVPADVKGNVTLIKAKKKASKLPENSCDVLLLRKAYHHFSHPEEQLTSLKIALKPNGRILVIDGYSDMEKPIPESSLDVDPCSDCNKQLAYQRHIDEFVAAGYRLERSELLATGLYLTEWKVK